MKVKAEFLLSSPNHTLCPPPEWPEYAFIGRSNVGKSSLINMLAGHKGLAKTSSTPGKTRLINHFQMESGGFQWLLADLPGYGYAKVSKKERAIFERMIKDYLNKRENLMCAILLLDGRLEPQKNDLEFMAWMGEKGIPFVMVFTKADKLSSSERGVLLKNYQQEMLKQWEALPQIFHTSATTGLGREDLLNFINETNKAEEEQH